MLTPLATTVVSGFVLVVLWLWFRRSSATPTPPVTISQGQTVTAQPTPTPTAAAAPPQTLTATTSSGTPSCSAVPSSTATTVTATPVPVSVNYHFTRRCNYSCGFCFHTATTDSHIPLAEAKHGLKLLRAAGCVKLNFSGGEPLIVDGGHHVGKLAQYCKRDLKYPSVSLVTNGSLVTEQWFEEYGRCFDIIAVSCDSFEDDTNRRIGRASRDNGTTPHFEQMQRVAQWCLAHRVQFKLNTVVNTKNQDEDMTAVVARLNPCRWKLFQCLEIDGENAGEGALRRARDFVIGDDVFTEFVEAQRDGLKDRGSAVPVVPESNDAMRNSYLILDERMRFLDNTSGRKTPSRSILDVGVAVALDASGFDESMFLRRGGRYKWTNREGKLVW